MKVQKLDRYYHPTLGFSRVNQVSHFNRRVIPADGCFKVLVRNLSQDPSPLEIRNEKGERIQPATPLLFQPTIRNAWGYWINAGVLGEGTFEVVAASSAHRLTVLSRDNYLAYWSSLLGTRWDSPVYWNEAGSGSLEDLLGGLPVDSAIMETEISSPADLYVSLGPIITQLIQLETGPPPFRCKYGFRSTHRFPNVDLTKLLSLLVIVGIVAADAAFFSRKVILTVAADSTAFSLFWRYSLRTLVGVPNVEDPLLEDLVPRLNDLPFQVKTRRRGDSFQLSLSVGAGVLVPA